MKPRFTWALAVVVAAFSVRAAAEVEMPPRNPRAKVSQQVGLTEVTVDYNSPAVRGRSIWGAAVPYGEVWRAGDSPASRITFSKDVVFAGKNVPAGTYALLAMPGRNEWTVILNRNATLAENSRDYRQDLDVARVHVAARPAPFRERLAFTFSDFTDEDAALDLAWEKVRVSMPIKVNTRADVVAAIQALDDVWRGYANVARYMLETKKDYDAGLKYVDRSLALKEDPFNLSIKASLLAAKGDHDGAHAAAARAQELTAGAVSPRVTATAPLTDDPPPSSKPAAPLEKVAPEAKPAFTSIAPELTPSTVLDERPAPIRAPAHAASRPPRPTEIAPVIDRGKPDLQVCYQRALRQDPSLARGRITVSVSIGVSGMVKAIALDSPHGFHTLEPCIKEAVSRWVFPPSSVEYGAEIPIGLQGKE